MDVSRDRITGYLARAEELRAIAETMKDAGAKALVLEIAREYATLATSLSALDRDGRDGAKPETRRASKEHHS